MHRNFRLDDISSLSLGKGSTWERGRLRTLRVPSTIGRCSEGLWRRAGKVDEIGQALQSCRLGELQGLGVV